MLEQGIMLLHRFSQENRVEVPQWKQNLRLKLTRAIGRNDFVAYIDAVGRPDGKLCLLEWKTISARYSEAPDESWRSIHSC